MILQILCKFTKKITIVQFQSGFSDVIPLRRQIYVYRDTIMGAHEQLSQPSPIHCEGLAPRPIWQYCLLLKKYHNSLLDAILYAVQTAYFIIVI